MTTCFLGLDFSSMTLSQTADRILNRPPDAPFGYAVTPNADHLVRLHRHPELTTLYRSAELCCLDSRVVAAIASLLGLRPPPVVTGSDLLAVLLARLPPSEKITIIGMCSPWLPRLMERTGIAPPAHFDPPALDKDPSAMDAAVSFALEHPARLVLLAVGSPRQEKLAARIKHSGQAHGFGLCVGAALEFLSGATSRAPLWMRQSGLEWFHRLTRNPRRLTRRYCFDDPPIVSMLLRERLSRTD